MMRFLRELCLSHSARRSRAILAVLALGALLVTGCFNPFAPRVAPVRGISQQPPEPTSAIGVLRLYEWCWNKRDPDLYRELFTDDYQFQFAQTDTAGNSYRDRALNREEELDIATNIFVRGTATGPPPGGISLVFDPNLVALPDGRRGKNGHFHKEIAAQTLLRFEDPDFEVDGTTRFFVVRGDSALLPQELIDRGFQRDSTRWFIERIEDETLNDDPASAQRLSMVMHGTRATRSSTTNPAQWVSWGQLKWLYDDRFATLRTRPSARP